jgi:Lecithin retinol acyltransferase
VSRADEQQSGGPQDVRRSKHRHRQFGDVCRGDRLLAANEEPPLGSHLVTPRRGFAHHGIYVGRGNIVHYRSVVRHFCRGPVEEVSLASFAQERAIWIRSQSAPRFDGPDQVERRFALPRRLARLCADAIAGLPPEDNRTLGRPIRVLRTLPRDRST